MREHKRELYSTLYYNLAMVLWRSYAYKYKVKNWYIDKLGFVQINNT